MYKIIHHQATVDASEFVLRYRDVRRIQSLCAQCPLHGKTWACPPYDIDINAVSEGFNQVILMADCIELNAQLREQSIGDDACRSTVQRITDEVWGRLLPSLYDMESKHPGSRCFTGRCRLCSQGCTRPLGLPCRHPEQMRYSLESAGFDVTAAVSDVLGIELQWSSDGRLPQCITLVTALFVK